jgi:hypothetical protein
MKNSTTILKFEDKGLQQLVSDRTIELAKLAGRLPHEIRQVDYEQAKREIDPNHSQYAM